MVPEMGDEGQGVLSEEEKGIFTAQGIPHLQVPRLRPENQGAQGQGENSRELQEMRQ